MVGKGGDRYQLGRRTRHYRRMRLLLLSVLVLGWGGFITYKLLHLSGPVHSTIHNASPHTRFYNPAQAAKIHIDKPQFTIDLPAGWTEKDIHEGVDVPTYQFVSPPNDAQTLQVFIDHTPATMPVNRVAVATVQGPHVSVGQVSDNCTTFTPPAASTPQTGSAPGKWQGVSFLCDTANYVRDVVGVTENSGINTISMTGQSGRPHTVFFAYIDNNLNPDFSTLYNILQTFTLK